MTGQNFNGVVLINKGTGMTSHDVVYKLRKILNMKKIGHTGTLDPNVSGLMVLCLGKATRIAEYLQGYDKTYTGKIKLGQRTDSQDASGQVVDSSQIIPSLDQILMVRDSFLGPIEQIPPMYSAVHHQGKRLHELARQGKQVERKPRECYIDSLDFYDYEYPFLSFSCTCSKGTYIRTLADDIGEELGSFAHLYSMTRTRLGEFTLDKAYTIEEIQVLVENNDYSFLLSMDESLFNFESIYLADEDFEKITNGIKIPTDKAPDGILYKIYCNNTFIGMGKIDRKSVCRERV